MQGKTPVVHSTINKNEFGEILSANKQFTSGELSVSEDGLLKIEFTNEEGVKVTYLLVYWDGTRTIYCEPLAVLGRHGGWNDREF